MHFFARFIPLFAESQTPSPSSMKRSHEEYVQLNPINQLIVYLTGVLVYINNLPCVFLDVRYMTHWVRVLSDETASLIPLMSFYNINIKYSNKGNKIIPFILKEYGYHDGSNELYQTIRYCCAVLCDEILRLVLTVYPTSRDFVLKGIFRFISGSLEQR